MPPVMPPPPVTNSATGSLEVSLAYDGVHTARERQSSDEDHAVDPWLSLSPTESSRFSGSYSFQKSLSPDTYCGQADIELVAQSHTYLEVHLPGP